MGYILHSVRQANDWYRELVGSFILIFIGTGALVTLNLNSQATTSLVIFTTILAFAVPYAWLIYIFNQRISGYYNPIITLWRGLDRSITASAAVSLFVAQFMGAILASIAVALLYGPAAVEVGLGAVYPNTSMGVWAAVVAETIGAACLLATYSSLSDKDSHLKKSVLLGFGLGIGLLAAVGISGAAINPVRNLAPQMAAADYTGWWAYWLGPLIAVGILWVVSHSHRAYGWLSGESARAKLESEAMPDYEQPVYLPDEIELEPQAENSELESIGLGASGPEQDEDNKKEEEPAEAPGLTNPEARKSVPGPTKVKFVNFDTPVDIDVSDDPEPAKE